MSAEQSTTETQIIELLRDLLEKPAELGPGTDMVSNLGLESVQIMEFVVTVEDHFDLMIDLDTLSDVRTVSELAVIVDKLALG